MGGWGGVAVINRMLAVSPAAARVCCCAYRACGRSCSRREPSRSALDRLTNECASEDHAAVCYAVCSSWEMSLRCGEKALGGTETKGHSGRRAVYRRESRARSPQSESDPYRTGVCHLLLRGKHSDDCDLPNERRRSRRCWTSDDPIGVAAGGRGTERNGGQRDKPPLASQRRAKS